MKHPSRSASTFDGNVIHFRWPQRMRMTVSIPIARMASKSCSHSTGPQF